MSDTVLDPVLYVTMKLSCFLIKFSTFTHIYIVFLHMLEHSLPASAHGELDRAINAIFITVRGNNQCPLIKVPSKISEEPPITSLSPSCPTEPLSRMRTLAAKGALPTYPVSPFLFSHAERDVHNCSPSWERETWWGNLLVSNLERNTNYSDCDFCVLSPSRQSRDSASDQVRFFAHPFQLIVY
jgi:hypothetical protein